MLRPYGKRPKVCCLLSPIAPLTSISIPHFGVFIYLKLRGDPAVPEGDVERFSSKEGLGRKPYFMPIGIWKAVQLSVGKFLAKSINRELEGGRALDFPSDLKLSAPPAHHLQDRSSECNRPFILMTLFYWCRNWGPESEAMCPRSQNELALFSIRDHTPGDLFPSFKSSMSLWQERIWIIVNNQALFRHLALLQPHNEFSLLEWRDYELHLQENLSWIFIFYSHAVCFFSLWVTLCFLLCKTRITTSTSWNCCCIKVKHDNIC